MNTVVIMPGGFHPFHAGHLALYDSARRVFPDAEVYVAATNDTSERPFPFAVKEKLAQLAGVSPNRFYQVKSPFRAEEITKNFDPNTDQLIFVRSEKDANKPPQAGGVKKDGSPAYLQPLMGAKKLEPFARHAYMAYLPTVEFGPGMTSATEIRRAWPQLNDRRKTALVMSLYPRTQADAKLAATVVQMLDVAILGSVQENQGWAATYTSEQTRAYGGQQGAGMTAAYQRRENQPVDEDYIEEKWSEKYKNSINCANPRGFSQRAHCAGSRKNEDLAEAFGPLPRDNQQIRLGRHTVDIERVGLNKNYIGFTWHDSKGQEHYEEVAVGDLGSYDDLIKRIKQEISYQERKYTDQGVAEGSDDDIWGPRGNFAGDKHVDIGGVTMKIIQVGDTVKYLGQQAKVVGMSKDRKYSRISIGSGFGGSVKDVLTADLKQLGQGVAEGLNEFDAQGFQQRYTLYKDDYEIEKFGDIDDAIEYAENDRRDGDDPSAVYKIVDINKQVVWDSNPYEKPSRIQLRKPEQGVAETQLAEKCWDTHRQVGMKKKGNRRVPNCVPK